MTQNSLEDALWIFSYSNPQIIPSYVVSGIMPANILGIKKLIYLINDDPQKTLNLYKPKTIIISKVFHKGVLVFVEQAKKQGVKVISIFDDWNFDKSSKTDNTVINLPLAKISDLIIVKTQAASEVLKQNTDLNSAVIPDMTRFKAAPASWNIDDPPKLIWFGMQSNHDSLIQHLEDINSLTFKTKLKIVTNFSNELKSFLNGKYKKIEVEIIEWHPNFNIEISNSNIVIIPYPKDKERLVKSSNRIIDSMNLGRFVVLSDVVQFSEFRNFSYFGNIAKGVDWAVNNKNQIKNYVLRAQKHVSENYSQEVVAKMWQKIIEKI